MDFEVQLHNFYDHLQCHHKSQLDTEVQKWVKITGIQVKESIASFHSLGWFF